MGTFVDRSRARVLSALTGSPDGRPDWVVDLERGDDAGFFGADSAAWAVHGALTSFVAGIRALLLQTLHPGAMAGVHDWSLYRDDPLGRLSRTVRWIVVVTFSNTAMAVRESNRIDRLHERVTGNYTDAAGSVRPYSARDTELLTWVHDVFTDSFLVCHQIWGGSIPGGADQYVREWAKAGELVGVQSPPRSAAELYAQLDQFRRSGALKRDHRVLEAVRFLRSPGLKGSMMPAYRVLFAGAVASIRPEDRTLLGLKRAWWPAVTATRLTLWGIRQVLHGASGSEVAARRRLARLGI